MTSLVWYQLVDGNGNPYKHADVDPLQIERQSVIGLLRQKIYENNKPALPSDCIPARLRIFGTKRDAIGNTNALASGSVIGGLGETENSYLYVVVPESVNRQRTKPEGIESLPSEEELVSRPGPTTNRLRWLPETQETYTIESRRLKFVNRSIAITQLLEIHNENFVTRRNDGAGFEFRLALIDNLYGMGKTTFAYRYISMCTSSGLFPVCDEQLQLSLSKSRTIVVRLGMSSLWTYHDQPDIKNCDHAIRDRFIIAVEELIKEGMLEGSTSFLKQDLDSTSSFVQAVTRFIAETKTPLFLVLDEIGSAFAHESLTLVQQRKLFLRVCSEILGETFMRSDLYLLLIGKAQFLGLVANRTPCSPFLDGSQVLISRVGLNMIRQDKIEIILDETFRAKKKHGEAYGNPKQIETLSQAYSLDAETEKIATDAILRVTNGHPRGICEMLQECTTLEQLLKYEPRDDVASDQTSMWVSDLMEYCSGVQFLMEKVESGENVNLTRRVFKNIRKSRTLLQLADQAIIRYEGTIEKARLFASRFVKRHLAPLFLPLRSFLLQLDTSTDNRYDHAGNFEISCFRRFQEMFARSSDDSDFRTPGTRFPKWFHGSLFGALEKFWLKKNFIKVPKISTSGARRFESLDQKTAVPELLPQIVSAMRAMSLPCNFFPADLSASSDVILVANSKLNNQERTVTIGLAVKCINKPLSRNGDRNSVIREQFIFNRMLQPPDSPEQVLVSLNAPGTMAPTLRSLESEAASPQSSESDDKRHDEDDFVEHEQEMGAPAVNLGKDLNILIICSSGGFSSTSFQEGQYHAVLGNTVDFPHIHETILLDLSSSERRQEFFGLIDDPMLAAKIDWMVAKSRS